MTIKAVLFDLDDTLLATSWSGPRRVRLAFRKLSEHHPELRWRDFHASVTQVDPTNGFWRGIRPALADLGLAGSDAAEPAIGLWFFDGCPELLRPSPYVRRALRRLAHAHALGVITNGNGKIQRRKFDELALSQQFDAFIASDDVGWRKPEPEIFHLALERLSVSPLEAAYVGDHPLWDIGGARNAGLHGIWYNPGHRELPDGITPDATIHTFADLPDVIRALETG